MSELWELTDKYKIIPADENKPREASSFYYTNYEDARVKAIRWLRDDIAKLSLILKHHEEWKEDIRTMYEVTWTGIKEIKVLAVSDTTGEYFEVGKRQVQFKNSLSYYTFSHDDALKELKRRAVRHIANLDEEMCEAKKLLLGIQE